MRNNILTTLNDLGIRSLFYVGIGAKSPMSEIHFSIDKRTAKLSGRQFALQFEPASQVVALWDIRERLARSASLNLFYPKDKMWQSIKSIETEEVDIDRKNSGVTAKIAAMPLSQFEDFLRFNQLFGFPFQIDNSDFDEDELQSVDIVTTSEGREIKRYGKTYERNKVLRDQAIVAKGYTCQICGFDFEEFYGEIGHEYIEVHHIRPLHQGMQTPDPTKDLVPVCANCHRMFHRKKYEILTPDELKEILKSQGSI